MRARFVLPAVPAAAFLLLLRTPPVLAGSICVVVAVRTPSGQYGASPDCAEVPVPTPCVDRFVSLPGGVLVETVVCVPL